MVEYWRLKCAICNANGGMYVIYTFSVLLISKVIRNSSIVFKLSVEKFFGRKRVNGVLWCV